MIKKILFVMGLGAIFVSVLLVFHQQPAVAAGVGCSGTSPAPISLPYCKGYFTTLTAANYDSTRDVLPSGLYDSNAASLESDIFSYLAGLDPSGNGECGTPKGPFRPTQCMAGAAFIIEAMLGHGAFNSSVATGVAQVKANSYADYNKWVNLVNSYATSTVPGYYVIWGTAPICISGGLNSGFSDIWPGVDPPGGINDDIFHNSDCPLDTTSEIQFHWPGGSFDIGENCGNIENSIGKIPPLPTNHLPTGSIALRCSGSQQIATISFSDPDYATSAHVTLSSSGGPPTQTVVAGTNNVTALVSPTAKETVYLFVKDVGPLGSQAYDNVANAMTQVPCPATTYTCGNLSVTAASTNIDPYTKFNVAVGVNVNGGSPPPGITMNLNISGQNYNHTIASLPATGNPLKSSVNGLGPTNGNGIYTVTWNLNPPYSVTNPPCSGTFIVTDLPYLQVYGGDVMIGASPTWNSGTGTGSCSANNSAGIYGWNNNNTDFSGAGTEYAVQALDQIEGFASAQHSTNTPPTGLSLSNVPPFVNTGQSKFGGFFGATTGDCDFSTNINTPLVNGPQTIASSPLTVNDGQQLTDYIHGNVYIANNIVYNQSGWVISPNINIPYFRLVVVGGNIYIGAGVTELDGLYVAEPDNSGTGGIIYTCATGNGSPVAANSGLYAACHSTLVINGSFVAKQVEFLRTTGSVGQATATDTIANNHAAEVFNYTPEMWLPRSNSISAGGYTAITGLPPVL